MEYPIWNSISNGKNYTDDFYPSQYYDFARMYMNSPFWGVIPNGKKLGIEDTQPSQFARKFNSNPISSSTPNDKKLDTDDVQFSQLTECAPKFNTSPTLSSALNDKNLDTNDVQFSQLPECAPKLNSELDVFCRALPLNIEFVKQPPEDLRKSLFFDFAVQIKSMEGPVNIERARFERFLNEDNPTRNGCLYLLRIRHPSGLEEKRYLYLTLVDASTREPIRYEGSDDSPRLQRVLLTHETICTRCTQHRSCGNKSETPGDPRIISKGVIQIHLRCNQNCLKNPGNPRENRRFAVALSFEDSTYDKNKITALSSKIFVHNNSKHSKNKKRKSAEIKQEPSPDCQAEAMYIHPRVGVMELQCFHFVSREWSKPGVTFRTSGYEMMITNMHPHISMTVQLPQGIRPGTIYITLYFNNAPVFTFPYNIESIAFVGMRPYLAQGYLYLQKKSQNNFPVDPSSGNAAVYIVEESECPGYHLRTYGASSYHPSYNYPPPEIQTYYPASYPNGSSSSSSLSPNGSHLSGENSRSPPICYYPHDPTY